MALRAFRKPCPYCRKWLELSKCGKYALGMASTQSPDEATRIIAANIATARIEAGMTEAELVGATAHTSGHPNDPVFVLTAADALGVPSARLMEGVR